MTQHLQPGLLMYKVMSTSDLHGCLANGLKCTDVCKLSACDNRCGDFIEEVVSDHRDEDEEI